jgi:isoquinoline 1-oxidoreductase beta subunit
MKSSISRRDFLKGFLGTAGLTIAASVTPFGYKILNAADAGTTFKPNVFYKITPDNLVTVYIPNSEMGQGVRTAMAMIIAEELDADWDQIRAVQAPGADGYKSPLLGAQITVASASVRGFYEPLRKAGAAGRAMLIKAAADTWKVPEDQCVASLGRVKNKKNGRTLKYGQLCAKAAELPVPKEVTLKKESDFMYIGKPMARLDIPDKVAGKPVFASDIVVKDMLYATIARPPAYGAKLVSFDGSAASQVKGVQNIVQVPRGVAVCANSVAAALKGRDALKVTWGKGAVPEMDTAYVEKSLNGDLDKPGLKVVDQGNAKQAFGDAPKKVSAEYYIPCVAHVTMEPMNCTAYVQADKCELWAPTQTQTVSMIVSSKVSGLPMNKIEVNTPLLGCGLGRRAQQDFTAEAVSVSKAIGKPVKVFWTREDDIRYDGFRGAAAHRVEAACDAQGKLVAWSHKLAATSILRDLNPAAIKNGIDYYCLWGLADSPNSPTWNCNFQYETPSLYIELLLSSLPVTCLPWRSVQNGPNAFVIESFIDELALAAGKDPLEFRLLNLKNNMRASRVLKVAAEKAGWGKPVAPGHGRGIAQHACFGSYSAQVADISVDKKSGKIKVHKVVAAIDCGPVVNPAPLVAQIQGGIIMSLSAALKEEVKFAKGGVASSNFDNYPIMRMSEAPDIEVHVVKSTEKIGGIGEVGVPAAAPALGNAFFNATGVRARRLPMTPANVLNAMKKA